MLLRFSNESCAGETGFAYKEVEQNLAAVKQIGEAATGVEEILAKDAADAFEIVETGNGKMGKKPPPPP